MERGLRASPDNYMLLRLRKKLGINVIQTVRGLGYCLDDPNAQD